MGTDRRRLAEPPARQVAEGGDAPLLALRSGPGVARLILGDAGKLGELSDGGGTIGGGERRASAFPFRLGMTLVPGTWICGRAAREPSSI